MDRRTIVRLLGLSLVARPLAAEAQPTAKTPRVGFVEAGSRSANQHYAEAFRAGLRELGYVINRKTAKAFGLTIPPSVLLRADEVIQ